jgi:hypothetical protein
MSLLDGQWQPVNGKEKPLIGWYPDPAVSRRTIL